MTEIHIPTLAPEALFHLGGVTITNTMINAWLAIIIFLAIGIVVSRRVRLRPSRWQLTFETAIETLWSYFDQVTGDRAKTQRFFPLVGSVFFFILLSNWLGLMPGTGSLTWGHAMVLRPANTDLNLTLAMALVSVVGSHVMAFGAIGVFTHLGKFIQLKNLFTSILKGPMAFFQAIVEFAVGLLEIVSEISKILSLSLRLFGNIFAGEVLISVISALVAALVPTPFMLLEILVGLIQAAVFAMLTLVYLTTASEAPHGAEEHH